MTSFLRGKQAGIQRDFSAGLDPRLVAIDEIARYGINSQISALAYDPVQSLLAVGTNDTKFGSGQIYVYGQKRVSVTLKLPRKASIKTLRFVADKLISVDTKNDLCVFSLETTRIITSYAPPGTITALATDPLLDYALIGLQNGEIIAFDLDRHNLTPLRIPNLLADQRARSRLLPVVSLVIHPRDLGSLLVGYQEGAVIFSFQQNRPVKTFTQSSSRTPRGGPPRLTHAVWHPTGTFILTAYEDSSIAIWDVKDGRQILHRAVEDTQNPTAMREPIFNVAWCAKENPDDTGILIAGGRAVSDPAKGLTFIDLGPTPVYATSSWQVLTEHFTKPKREHLLPTPPNAEVVQFCLIPRKSPHFAGASDPIALIAALGSGEMVTLTFPSGHQISPTNQLHVSLTFVHPFVDRISLAYVDRTRWLGLVENRPRGPPFLKGGAEAKHSIMRYANRNIIQTAHADGMVRVYDVGHGDEVENGEALQIDVARAVGRYENIDISAMSMSSVTAETAVGLRSGEVIVFRWGMNSNFGRDAPHQSEEAFGLENVMDRADPGVKEGLIPLCLFNERSSAVTALKASDIGFICAGYESGNIAIIDLRGPAVIFEASMAEFGQSASKRASFRRHDGQGEQREYPTAIEFGAMTLDGENFSSILLFVGTSTGRVMTFKLLPSSSGGYSVSPAGNSWAEDHVVAICPLNIETGEPAVASQDAVAGLRSGNKISGSIVVVTRTSARIFKPPNAKGAAKTWDNFICYQATVAAFEAHTFALVGLFGDGTAKAFSLPGLKEIASADVARILDIRRIADAVITPTGFIFGWTGPSEIAALNIWGSGQDLTRSLDRLFNPEAIIPPRPTISNLQWISGTTHVTSTDMDKLIGGPDRPPSKRMIEQMRSDEQAQRSLARQNTAGSASSAGAGKQQEGYWAYMQRQIQERTENLGMTSDSMDRVEENSEGFASDVNKFIRDQKKAAVKGFIGSKLGL